MHKIVAHRKKATCCEKSLDAFFHAFIALITGLSGAACLQEANSKAGDPTSDAMTNRTLDAAGIILIIVTAIVILHYFAQFICTKNESGEKKPLLPKTTRDLQ